MLVGDVLLDETEHIEGFECRRAPDFVGVKDRGLMLSEPGDEMIQDDAAIDVSIEEEGDVHVKLTDGRTAVEKLPHEIGC